MTARPSGTLRRLATVCLQDLRWLPRDFCVNVLAAATVTPRPVRALIYRGFGIRSGTLNLSAGCSFTGEGGVTIGAGSFVNLDCTFDALAAITIGRNCAIAPGVLICTSTHELAADGSFGAPVGKPVLIGDRCWLGARVTVLPGVRIGDRVVVAAGAVVTEDCLPDGLYAGVPARRVRELGTADRTATASA